MVVFVLGGILGGALVVSAAPGVLIQGIGGMTVKSDHMTFTSMTAYPTVNRTATSKQRLLVTVEIEGATANSMTLLKELDLSRYSDVPVGGTVRIRMHSDNVGRLNDAILRVSAIDADQYNLQQFTVDEGYVDESTADPAGPNDPVELLTTGQSGSFENVTLQVHHMAIDRLDLSGFTIDVQYDPDNDGTFEYS